MKNIFYFIFFGLVLALGLIFTLYNSKDVVFHYIIGSISIPLSLVVIIAISIGVFLGLFASSMIIMRIRKELIQIKRTQRKAEL